jgi:ABC-2 type transport system ATP-binding protein
VSSAEAVIDAVHLTKHYGRRRGIEDVAFSVQRGEIFGFLGPNGAGKTTTIRAVLGLVHPQRGHVDIFGHPARELDRSRLGFVPGELSLYERMTGAQLLDYLAALTRRPPLRRAALLERFALSRQDLLRPIRHYSRGMKQKVGVVQALQHDPELLVLDEPAEGLDPLMQQEFYELLGELRAEGRTVFISSHLLWEVERICDRVAIIRDGLLVTTERIDTLRQRSARRVDVQFAQANDATAFRPPEGVTVERVEGVRLTLRVPAERTAAVLDALAGRQIADLVWELPSLEEIFLAYYRRDPDAR